MNEGRLTKRIKGLGEGLGRKGGGAMGLGNLCKGGVLVSSSAKGWQMKSVIVK